MLYKVTRAVWFSFPEGIMIIKVAPVIFRDMHTLYEHFIIPENAIRICQGCLTQPDRFDLRPGKLYPGYEFLKKLVIVGSLLVPYDNIA